MRLAQEAKRLLAGRLGRFVGCEDVSTFGRDDRVERVADQKNEAVCLQGFRDFKFGKRETSCPALVREPFKELAFRFAQFDVPLPFRSPVKLRSNSS